MTVRELVDQLTELCQDEPARWDADITAGTDMSPVEGGVFTLDNTELNLAPIPLHLQQGGF